MLGRFAMRRYFILILLSLGIAAVHLFVSWRWGLFFPLPLMGQTSTIWAYLTVNSVLQSFILVFGFAHILGIAREQTAFGGRHSLWTGVYSLLLALVALAWIPGFTLFHR
jgi:hypothetical protein